MRYRVLFSAALFFYALYSIAQLPKNYPQLLQEMAEDRSRFNSSYTKADSTGKNSVITKARQYLLVKITTDIFPQWYGTPWDFYGTTRTPKQGKIACGYFVTTVLQDAGFNIPRIAWAKSASEVFIKKLVADAQRFSNKSIDEIKSYLIARGDGLYIAGLDNHVGFVWVHSSNAEFIHSNYYQPEQGVMSQDIRSKSPFYYSHYRVIGKLLSDEMVIRWILDAAYK